MKISVCIPQFNRIDFLMHCLGKIADQTYADIEVVISDDASTDDTEARIRAAFAAFKYPIRFSRNEINLGYDRNFRQSLELATGQYAIVLGNDDALSGRDSVQRIVECLIAEGFPDLGYCNMFLGSNEGTIVRRAFRSGSLGSGPDTALKYYSSLSFVGGLIFKLDSFHEVNSSLSDGSVYSQMYLGALMIIRGGTLFCIDEPLIIKDIHIPGFHRGSYKDRIARTWRDFRVVDGGLPSVMHVIINAFRNGSCLNQHVVFSVFWRTYFLLLPYWILDYRAQAAFPEAWGIFRGLAPGRNPDFKLLSVPNRSKIRFYYWFSGLMALSLPVSLLVFIRNKVYNRFKK